MRHARIGIALLALLLSISAAPGADTSKAGSGKKGETGESKEEKAKQKQLKKWTKSVNRYREAAVTGDKDYLSKHTDSVVEFSMIAWCETLDDDGFCSGKGNTLTKYIKKADFLKHIDKYAYPLFFIHEEDEGMLNAWPKDCEMCCEYWVDTMGTPETGYSVEYDQSGCQCTGDNVRLSFDTKGKLDSIRIESSFCMDDWFLKQ